ncbi:hypothetical protein CPB97_008223 [Podila verticillata]|nr:hypothetical protein CPB97_008223 [Podila verticillata]
MTSVEFTGPCLPRGPGFPAPEFKIADHVDAVRKPNDKVLEVTLRYYLLTGIRAVEMLAYYPNLQTLNLVHVPFGENAINIPKHAHLRTLVLIRTAVSERMVRAMPNLETVVFRADTGDASAPAGGNNSWTINRALLERFVEHLPNLTTVKIDRIQLRETAPTAVQNGNVRGVFMTPILPIQGYFSKASLEAFKL